MKPEELGATPERRLVVRGVPTAAVPDFGSERAYAYENAANSFDVRFKERLDEEFMQFGAAGERFTMTMLPAPARSRALTMLRAAEPIRRPTRIRGGGRA